MYIKEGSSRWCQFYHCKVFKPFPYDIHVLTVLMQLLYHLPIHDIHLLIDALYPLGPVATLRFCHLRPRCVSKQRRTTNVIISDRVWWIWCDAGLATVATRPQRSPHSVASNSRPDYFAATRSRSLFLTINECCVSAAAAAIWEIQWRRSTPQLAPVDTGGDSPGLESLWNLHYHFIIIVC